MLETTPYEKKITKKRICVVDTETDPFKEGRIVAPFSLGFYDPRGHIYKDFWGNDCIHKYFDWLRETYEEELLIYAHNGGGFDFFFMLDYIDHEDTPVIINGRLTKISFQGQEYRDSFKIIPAPLSAYQKDEIDYNKFERGEREKHKDEILHYQRKDCEYLAELVLAYHETFGDQLTIGSTSIAYLKHFHGFELFSEDKDDKLRPYYFGGRNQCFETGVIQDQLKLYDVNSMYPSVMRDYEHPVGKSYSVSNRISRFTQFVTFRGSNYNALPTRTKTGLDFTIETGEFHASIHEIEAGEETGTIKIDQVIAAYDFYATSKFDTFIDYFYELRLEAKRKKDAAGDLFYKLLMNNSYGKFAQDPRKYSDWLFTIGETPEEIYHPDDNPLGWQLDSTNGDTFIWSKAAKNRFRGFRHVACASSITGASRAKMLKGICSADRPLYCDTDSIVCRSLNSELDDKKLGAWKLEAIGDQIAIAGKKLYCLTDRQQSTTDKGEPRPKAGTGYAIKWASKGAKLTPSEIIKVAQGDVIRYANPVPHFKLDGRAEFVTRNIRATV